jgi:hypothetical protein
MISLGSVRAFNLDGGGSTQLWYDKGYLIQSSENRAVAEGLLVFPEPPTAKGTTKSIHIFPGQTVKFLAEIPPEQAVATDSTTWTGSDVVMTLTAPSGRMIDRNTVAQDIVHDLGLNFETYTLSTPESGDWEVTLFGADVPTEGEDVVFKLTTASQAPLPQLAYVDGSTLVLNMGAAERRYARNIEPDEINEEFVVRQLSAELPGKFSVTA